MIEIIHHIDSSKRWQCITLNGKVIEICLPTSERNTVRVVKNALLKTFNILGIEYTEKLNRKWKSNSYIDAYNWDDDNILPDELI